MRSVRIIKKSKNARDRFRQPPTISPRWANRSATPTHKNPEQTEARATMDVRSRHRTNPWSPRFLSGKTSEYKGRRPRRYHVDPWSRSERLPTASYALRPNLIFFLLVYGEEGLRLFSTHHQPKIHLRSRHRVNPRSTRFGSGKASEYRWPSRR